MENTDQQTPPKPAAQRITTHLDYVLEDDNHAAVGFAIQDLTKEGWEIKGITKNKDGKFVIWVVRIWGAQVGEAPKS